MQKKNNPRLQLTQLAVFLARPESFPSLNSRVSGAPVCLTPSSIPGGLCHRPQDVCPASKGVIFLCTHKTVAEQVLAPG